ncbi:MAG: tetratricopeptide repeat protein [Pseudomonadota bacterium]
MLRYCFAAVFLLALAGCDTAEERAEEHYQSALALLAEGDLERATVEFRNVFELNGLHVDARRSYAEALRADGNLAQAFSQFLRLAEQRPGDVPALLALAEMSIDTQSWQQLQLHGGRLVELVPAEMRAGEEGESVTIVAATLDYANAVEAEDDLARIAAAERARALLAENPDNLGLHRVVIDNALREGDPDASLTLVDSALATAPDNRALHDTRLRLVAQLEDAPAVRAQLEDMIVRFPEDQELVSSLIRFLVSQDDMDAAEAFLRARLETLEATSDAEEITELSNALIQFLLGTQGAEAALAEVDRQIEAGGSEPRLRLIEATIRFSDGEREIAISQMQALIDGGESSVSELNDAKVVLAGMLVQDGNPVGARRLVGEVLESDATQTTAMLLEAGWLIEDDKADDAISLLRRALDDAPNSTEAMTLMARAHGRNGNHELARDFLALAFEASNAGPAETLRYAGDLVDDELYLVAEEALITALRLQPGNIQLLDQLGRIYVAMGDWGRAEGVEDAARRQGTEAGDALASGLRVARLTARGQTEDALAFLETLAAEESDGTGLAARLGIIGTLMEQGDTTAAMAYIEEALAEAPGNVALRMARGAVERADGDIDAAIATYRGITEDSPVFERAWIELIRAEFAAGRSEAAEVTLAAALATLPEGVNLLWAQASFLEQSGDVDGAIAIYEALYDELPNAPVVANNLASLISTYRTDAESLERAYTVARRLRGTEVPQMMDTYGWITFRRGEIDEARPYLAAAAEALPEDPLVQFHYGMLLSAAGQQAQAVTQLERALEIAGPDARPQFDTARAELERLAEAQAEAVGE